MLNLRRLTDTGTGKEKEASITKPSQLMPFAAQTGAPIRVTDTGTGGEKRSAIRVDIGGGDGGTTVQSTQPFRNPLAPGGPNPNATARKLSQTTSALEQARADYVTAQHDARQTVYRPHGDNDAYREARRETSTARNNVNALNREAARLSNNPSFGSRVKNTVIGGVGRSLASDVNSKASAFELTQGARNRMMNEYLADYEHGLKRAQNDLRQMEESGASVWDAEQQRMIVNDWQRKVDAMKEAIAAQPKAAQAVYDLADSIQSSADSNIDNAKRGLDSLGKLAVDVGAEAAQVGTDVAKSWYLLNRFNINSDRKLEDAIKRLPLIARAYGENAQAARREGADASGAALYGATSAAIDAGVEKAVNGLMGAYGVGKYDEQFRNAFKQLAKTDEGQKLLGTISSGSGEFGESVITSIINQTMESLYNRKDSIHNLYETDFDHAFNDAIVDFIMGLPDGIKREFFGG